VSNTFWVSGYSDVSIVADALVRAMSNNAGRFPTSGSVSEADQIVRSAYLKTTNPHNCSLEHAYEDAVQNARLATPSEISCLTEAGVYLAQVSLSDESCWTWTYANLNEGYVVTLLNSNMRE
jgi:hypothetical protein